VMGKAGAGRKAAGSAVEEVLRRRDAPGKAVGGRADGREIGEGERRQGTGRGNFHGRI
jgi:hypothetical protein